MKTSMSVLCVLACLLVSGCHASRPLLSVNKGQWGGGGGCSGQLNFGDARAVAVPGHNLIMGQVHLRNNGPQPYGFQSGGVKLAGPRGPLDCNLRCPQNIVPAGGSLQCGFVAQAPQPLSYTTFQPFFVPQSSGGQCFGQQPFFVRPVPTPAIASAQSNAFANAGVAQSFADACAQAFGTAYSDALSKATAWQGDAYSLANSIANGMFGATASAQSNAQSWGGVASAQGNANANAAFGPAIANSASNAIQSGWNGVASAVDQATAISGNGPAAASSQSNAFNAGGGPAIASSSATAISGGNGCSSNCGK